MSLKSVIRGVFSKPKYKFSDSDREKSSMRRKMSHIQKARLDMMKEEIDYMKQLREQERLAEQLQDLQEDMYGEEEEEEPVQPADMMQNPDALLMQMFSKIMETPNTVSNESNGNSTAIGKIDLTNDQIAEYWGLLPKYQQKIAKKMPDAQIVQFIHSKEPNLSDASISKILSHIRAQ